MAGQSRLKIYAGDRPPHQVWALTGQTIWDALESAGINPGGDCGGRGTCGKCRIKVEGQVSPPGKQEVQLIKSQEWPEGYRLACLCQVWGEAGVYLQDNPDTELTPLLPVSHLPRDIAPAVRRIPGTLPPLQPEQPLSLWERVQRVFPAYLPDLTTESWNRLSALDQSRAHELTGVAIGSRLIDLATEATPVLGVALDIGTTSLLAILVNLVTGEELAISSSYNPQGCYGADVVSRISYAMDNPSALKQLQQTLIVTVNSMLKKLASEAGLSRQDIYQVTIVGNPVMLHLFLGLEVRGFARTPFTGVFKHLQVVDANRIAIEIHPRGIIHILPQIGGFVGADTVAGLLTLKAGVPLTFLYLDIGTNGEMVLYHQGQWWACSAAAGPAFEGGNISRGMRAEPGAIYRAWAENGLVEFNTLGTGPPRGICGSGLVDLAVALLDAGFMGADGYLKSGAGEFVLSRGGTSITLTQEDIRHLQLAKGAIRAAVDIMLKRAGISPDNLERVYLAGAFGNCLHVSSMLRTGILPPMDENKLCSIGNAAAGGAELALLSKDKVEESVKLAHAIKYIELAAEPDFQEIFLRSLNFG